jgi:HEPN domain-containing protein
MNRWRDWFEQSLRDQAHARHALDDEDYEWAAFAAQQAAEKALKALLMARGGEPWGHLVTALAEALSGESSAATVVLDAARRLDKHYIPARYPNGFAAGYPGRLYSRGEAEQAIADAATITDFEHAHPRDRVPDLLRALSPLPCPVDLFVAIRDEFERARQERSPLVREALATGIDLI